ncbi:MAG: hypothetical protein L6R41_006011 [Letrouitia leprolyta]|nr:MAG: hypothetical protein L6R41_006011 [Letrouitia leprolyta]
MQLLPIIIVVSLLAFFLALTLIILAWRAFTAAERRTKRRAARSKKHPGRQLTLRNGKLVPLPHEIYGLGKQEFNSTDLSTVRTGDSDKSREKPRRIPFTLTPLAPKPKLFGPRDSSPPSDLEAQTSIDPNKFEENLKTLQLLNKRLLEDPQNRVMPRRADQRRKWHGDNRDAAHSRKITESLQKAYNVPSLSSRQVSQISDYPVSPKSRPIPRHLRRPDQTLSLSDPAYQRASKARSESIQHRINSIGEHLDPLSPTKSRQPSGKSFSLPADFPIDAIQTVPAVKVPPPVVAVDVRSSKGRIDSFDARKAASTISTHTTKTRNSRTSSAAHSTANSKRASTVPSIPPLKLALPIKVPPPTPATTTSSLEKAEMTDVPKPLRPSPTKVFKSGAKADARHPRPPDIDVAIANAPHKTSSPLLESQPVTPETQILVGQSARSTRSFNTFASSDLSSTWTFGNAQKVPIFPSVTPKAIGVEETGNHIAPLRPKSKYGRQVKATGMKALPVLPKSPLSREEVV